MYEFLLYLLAQTHSIRQMDKINMFRIFVIGTTGVGKTKLSIELAKYLNGQVISCDSKQLYKHATIMTAKVTQQEAEGIPHYMVDCLELHQNTYNRNKFYKEAAKAMKIIQEKNKTPICVGGTNYYTETLLYNLNRTNSKNIQQSEFGQQSEQQNQQIANKRLTKQQEMELQAIKKLTKQQKYELLAKYDQLIAQKTHRNNQQKIQLFLERIIKDKKRVSDHYQTLTQDLRTKNSIVFWLKNSNKEELYSMITKRIYKMLDQAGIAEIFSIYHYLELHKRQITKTQELEIKPTDIQQYSGAASSIGIKQFLPLYLEVKDQLHTIFKEDEQDINNITYEFIHSKILTNFELMKYQRQTLAKCTEQLILDTKHYCKRQVTWIRNRMFINQKDVRSHFFVLDLQQKQKGQPTPIMDRFEKQIKQKAIHIIQTINQNKFGSILEDQQHFVTQTKVQPLQDWKKYVCEDCKIQLNGLFDWNNHISSKRHIKQAKYQQKKEERDKYIQEQRKMAEKRRQKKQQDKLQIKDLQNPVLDELEILKQQTNEKK